MSRTVTVKDIAQEAEVSIATVSRVLNNQEIHIAEHVRQRVLTVAADLGYVKQNRQEGTKKGTQGGTSQPTSSAIKDIGFILTHSDADALDLFWAYILHGAETEARKQHIRLTYQAIPLSQAPQMLMSKAYEMRVDGLLLVGPTDIETIRTIQQTHLPLVLVDNYVHVPEQQPDALLSDNIEGTRDAITYLVSMGHRRIAFLGGYSAMQPTRNRVYSFEQRKEGYLSALRDADIPIDERLIVECNAGSSDDVNAAVKHLLDAQTSFTALFCVNDPVAFWAIRALRERGVSVPEDVSIIGFDDVVLAEHLNPALTTLHVNKEAMGVAAVRQLLIRHAEPDEPNVRTILGVRLVKRDSVRSLLL